VGEAKTAYTAEAGERMRAVLARCSQAERQREACAKKAMPWGSHQTAEGSRVTMPVCSSAATFLEGIAETARLMAEPHSRGTRLGMSSTSAYKTFRTRRAAAVVVLLYVARTVPPTATTRQRTDIIIQRLATATAPRATRTQQACGTGGAFTSP